MIVLPPLDSRCCLCERRYTVTRWFRRKPRKYCPEHDPFTAHIRHLREQRRKDLLKQRRLNRFFC